MVCLCFVRLDRSEDRGVRVHLIGKQPSSISAEANQLSTWYQRTKRDLPWRHTLDPYAIWVSETMLQQTRVDTVIPYFYAFLSRFPVVTDLAVADFEEVAKLWQGLGYYSRARNLHRAAGVVTEQHGGVIPSDQESFSALPGVGPYTTGAVLSIAFGQPIPAIDGNVLRVMTRFLGIHNAVELPSTKRTIAAAVERWLRVGEARVLTQALMELGATVCVPKHPACGDCPLQGSCVATAEGTTAVLPVKRAKPQKRKIDVYAVWCEADGHILVQRRPDHGLLAGMWQLPAVELPPPPSGTEVSDSAGVAVSTLIAEALTVGDGTIRESGTAYEAVVELAVAKHLFTHIEWQVHVVRPVGVTYGSADGLCAALPFRWVPIQALSELVWPRVYERLLERILGDQVTLLASHRRHHDEMEE